MKNKIIFAFIALSFVGASSAEIVMLQNGKTIDTSKSYPNGLKSNGSGVHLVSDSDDRSSARIMGTFSKESENLKSITNKGYVNCAENCSFNEKMLDYLKGFLPQYSVQSIASIEDGHLKHDIPQQELSFKYTGISFLDKKNVIGYAAIDTYKDMKWTGVATYFLDKSFGSCVLYINDLKSNGSDVSIRKSAILNIKEGRYFLEPQASGNDKSGFSYDVSWYSEKFGYMLTCVLPEYSASVKSDIIQFAKKIDDDVKLG